MTMMHMPPIFENSSIEISIDQIEDAHGIQSRFIESFSQFVQDKKREAVEDVLRDEFPTLIHDESFIQNTIARMGNDVIEEKRFVFLAVNPRYRDADLS